MERTILSPRGTDETPKVITRQAQTACGCNPLRAPRAVELRENFTMSPPSQKIYPQDKQPGGPPPAYPNQAYHPPSQRCPTVSKKKEQYSDHSDPDPAYKPGQYQPQPQPQVIYVERRRSKDNGAGLCATAWLVSGHPLVFTVN